MLWLPRFCIMEKQEQQPAVFGSSAAAAAVQRDDSSSCSNNKTSSSAFKDQDSNQLVCDDASSSVCRSSLSSRHENSTFSLFSCGEKVVAATSGTAVATNAAVPIMATTTAPDRNDRGGSSSTNGSLLYTSSSSSSFCCFSLSSSCSAASLLRSLCRRCSSSITSSSRTSHHGCGGPLPTTQPLPPLSSFDTSQPEAAAAAAQTSTNISKNDGCCCPLSLIQQGGKLQQHLQQLQARLRCEQQAPAPLLRKSSSFRFPVLLQTPAIITLSLMMCFQHTPQEAAGQLKFAALGNWGFESGSQQQVAETLKQVARAEHLSFLVSPGSNFAGGVSGPKDNKWKRLFEDVYSDSSAALKMPFFTVLGTEDWSGGDYTAEVRRTEVAYSPTGKYQGSTSLSPLEGKQPSEHSEERSGGEDEEEEIKTAAPAEEDEETAAAKERHSADTYPKWTLPNWWYHYLMHFPASTGTAFINSGHKDMSVGLLFLDTWVLSSSFPFSEVSRQAWREAETTLSLAPKLLDYIVVVTDRPVYSSGSSKGDSNLQYYLKPLLERADIDLLISGYDFSQEIIVRKGISYVNCGAGSFGVGSSMVKDSGSQFYSGRAGFCVFELTADGLVTRLIDGANGEILHTYKQPLKKRPERKTIDAFKFVSQLPEVKYVPVPSMGKMPGRDVFVRVVGTIGLCIATFFASLTVASVVSRYSK